MWKTNSDGATSYFVDGKLVASYYNGAKIENGRKVFGRWINLYGDYPTVYRKRQFSTASNEKQIRKTILSWLSNSQ